MLVNHSQALADAATLEDEAPGVVAAESLATSIDAVEVRIGGETAYLEGSEVDDLRAVLEAASAWLNHLRSKP